MNRQTRMKSVKRIVVKVGTSTLTHDTGLINYEMIEKLVRQLANLKNNGYEVILVSSGAVGAGLSYLTGYKRPMNMRQKQACAAVGQVALVHIYRKVFSEYGKDIAQILLTKADIADRERYLNARDAFFELLEHDVIPIVNENDAVVTDEIKVGDNDTLSALVSNLVDGDLLVILSDIEGLYDKNPMTHKDAKLLPLVKKIDEDIINSAGGAGSAFGTGGMVTKLKAAEIVTTFGSDMIIAKGNCDNVLNRLVNGEELGTLFIKNDRILNAKKQWINYGASEMGTIIVDAGAKKAILSNKSLLPIGIKSIKGEFKRGAIVEIADEKLNVIAKGITNYDASDLSLIKGVHSQNIQDVLGYNSYNEAVHVNNMSVKEA